MGINVDRQYYTRKWLSYRGPTPVTWLGPGDTHTKSCSSCRRTIILNWAPLWRPSCPTCPRAILFPSLRTFTRSAIVVVTGASVPPIRRQVCEWGVRKLRRSVFSRSRDADTCETISRAPSVLYNKLRRTRWLMTRR